MENYKIIFNSNLSWENKLKLAGEVANHKVSQGIHKNIKSCFKGQTVWSRFNNDYKSTEDDWEHKTFFYYGDLENFEKDDWRFSKVKNKRTSATFEALEIHQEKHGLKQNHIKDYLKYLKKYGTE